MEGDPCQCCMVAKKLKDCNIFGASSGECLNFALQNHQEWETRGETIIASMTKQIEPATIKRMAKATSAQAEVPLDTSLENSEMKCVTAAPPESVKSA
jgi:hypothetical protein